MRAGKSRDEGRQGHKGAQGCVMERVNVFALLFALTKGLDETNVENRGKPLGREQSREQM
jgi:hypothetical protein